MARAQSHEPTPKPRPTNQSVAPPASAKPSWAFKIAGWVVPERYPAGVVYGLITVGALLAAESGLKDTYPETVGSIAIAMTLYWFAHAYADVLGLRLSEQRRVGSAELWHTFVQDWSIVRGAGLPLLALAVAWAFGASQSVAVTAGRMGGGGEPDRFRAGGGRALQSQAGRARHRRVCGDDFGAWHLGAQSPLALSRRSSLGTSPAFTTQARRPPLGPRCASGGSSGGPARGLRRPILAHEAARSGPGVVA